MDSHLSWPQGCACSVLISAIVRSCGSSDRTASGVSARGRCSKTYARLPRDVEHGTGVGALGAIGEQPALPANHKGTDGILGGVIVDGQVAVFQVGGELRPQV